MQIIVSEELAEGPYGAVRAGLEPAIPQMKGDESTNEPPRHHQAGVICLVNDPVRNVLHYRASELHTNGHFCLGGVE